MPKIIDDNKVFKVTLELLVEQGYEKTTTKKIASVSGIHEASLFRKYGNKAKLIEKAIDTQFSATPLNKIQYTGNIENDLYEIVLAYIETNQIHGQIIPILLIEIPKYPELSKVLSRPLDNIQGILRIISKYQKQGLLKIESPLMTVSAIISPIMIHGLFYQSNKILPEINIDIKEYVNNYLYGRSTQ